MAGAVDPGTGRSVLTPFVTVFTLTLGMIYMLKWLASARAKGLVGTTPRLHLQPGRDLKMLRPYVASSRALPFPAEFERWTKDPQTQKAVDMLVQLTKEVEGPVNIDMQPVIGRGIFMSGTPGVGKSTLFDSFAAYIQRNEYPRYALFYTVGDILDQGLGGTDKNIAAVFNEAQIEAVRTDAYIIIYIDECDKYFNIGKIDGVDVVKQFIYHWDQKLPYMRIFIYMTSNTPRSKFDSALMSRFHAARVEDLTTKELTARAIALVEAEIQRVPMSKWPIKWDDVTMGDVEPRELVFNTLIQAQRNLYSDGTQSYNMHMLGDQVRYAIGMAERRYAKRIGADNTDAEPLTAEHIFEAIDGTIGAYGQWKATDGRPTTSRSQPQRGEENTSARRTPVDTPETNATRLVPDLQPPSILLPGCDGSKERHRDLGWANPQDYYRKFWNDASQQAYCKAAVNALKAWSTVFSQGDLSSISDRRAIRLIVGNGPRAIAPKTIWQAFVGSCKENLGPRLAFYDISSSAVSTSPDATFLEKWYSSFDAHFRLHRVNVLFIDEQRLEDLVRIHPDVGTQAWLQERHLWLVIRAGGNHKVTGAGYVMDDFVLGAGE